MAASGIGNGPRINSAEKTGLIKPLTLWIPGKVLDEETLDHLFGAYIFGIPILDSWKDPEHWFSRTSAGEELEDFYRRGLSVLVSEIVAEGSWWGARVVLCRGFSLTLEGYGTQEVKRDAFIKGTFFIMDAPLHFNYPIDQAFSFQTEGEDFDEAGFDAAMEEFRAQVAVMKKDLCGLIRSGLRPFTDALQGQVFWVAGRSGEIHVENVRP